jgi:ABC-type lipoprotein release transport system permease subunit
VLISENLELKYKLKAGESITLNTRKGIRTFLYNIHLLKLLMSLGPVLLVSLLAGYILACKAGRIPLAKSIRYE